MNEFDSITVINLSKVQQLAAKVADIIKRVKQLEDQYHDETAVDINALRNDIAALRRDLDVLYDEKARLDAYFRDLLEQYVKLDEFNELVDNVKTVHDDFQRQIDAHEENVVKISDDLRTVLLTINFHTERLARIDTRLEDVNRRINDNVRRINDTSVLVSVLNTGQEVIKTDVIDIKDRLSTLERVESGMLFSDEEVKYLREFIFRDRNETQRLRSVFMNGKLQKQAQEHRDDRENHQYPEQFLPAREVLTVDEFVEMMEEYDEDEIVVLSEYSLSIVSSVLEMFREREYVVGVEVSEVYDFVFGLTREQNETRQYYVHMNHVGRCVSIEPLRFSMRVYISLRSSDLQIQRFTDRTYTSLEEIDTVFTEFYAHGTPDGVRGTANDGRDDHTIIVILNGGVVKHHLQRGDMDVVEYKKPELLREQVELVMGALVTGASVRFINAKQQSIPGELNDVCNIKIKVRDYNDFTYDSAGQIIPVTMNVRRDMINSLITKMMSELYGAAIRAQIDLYGAQRLDAIDELREGGLEDGAYVSVSIAELTSAVDDLLATTIRYEEKKIEFSAIRAALYPAQLSVPFVGYSQSWSSRAQSHGVFDGPQWRLEYVGMPVSMNLTELNVVTRDDAQLPAVLDYTLYDDDDFWIIVRIRSTYGNTSTNTTMNTVTQADGMITADSGSSFIEGLFATLHGRLPIMLTRGRVTHEIRELIVIDKKGVAIPIFDSLEGMCTLAMRDGTEVSLNLSNAVSAAGDIVIAGARYNAIFVDVERTVSRDAFRDGQVSLYQDTTVFLPTLGRPGANKSIDFYPSISNAFPNSSFLMRKSYLVSGQIRTLATYLEITLGWNACVNTLISNSLLGANASILGTTWQSLFPNASAGRLAAISELAVGIRINDFVMTLRVAMPPANVGVRRTVDTTVELLDLAIETERIRIDQLENDVTWLAARMDVIEQQIQMVYDRMNPSFGRQLINVITEMVLSVVMPVGIGLLFKGATAIMRAARPLLKTATNILVTIKSKARNLTKQIRNALPVESIGLHMAKISNGVKVRNRSLKSYMPAYVPEMWNLSPNYATLFPDVGIELAERTMYVSSKTINQIRAGYDGPLNNFAVYARPFHAIPSKISNVLFKLSGAENVRRQNLRHGSCASNKRPFHSFGVHRDYQFDRNSGRIRENVTLIGAGEPGINTKLGVKEGINGVQIGFEYVNVGGSVWNRRRMTAVEMGYNQEQLRNTFNQLYHYKLPAVDYNLETMWRLICHGVDDRIKKSTRVDDFYFGSKYNSGVLRDILNNPPDLSYNLFNRNCQNLTNELANIFRSRPLRNDRWGLEMANRLERLYYSSVLTDLDGLSSVVVRALINLLRSQSVL